MDNTLNKDNYKIINKSLYGGSSLFSKSKSPYECDTTYCCNTENCPLYAKGECLNCRRLGNCVCPYSKVETQIGKGPRSKSYSDLKYKTNKSEYYNKMKDSECAFAIIGDYLFIKHSAVSLWNKKGEDNYKFYSCWTYPFNSWSDSDEQNNWRRQEDYSFIPKDKITIEHFKELLELKPRTLFDNTVISSYQKETIPKIKKGILKYFPDWAKELGIKEINYVGLKGKLNTLKGPFDFTIDNSCTCVFHWDNEYVTVKNEGEKLFYDSKVYNSEADILPFDVKLKPKDWWIKIEDNSWVTNDSEVK